MKRKIISVTLALVMLASFSLTVVAVEENTLVTVLEDVGIDTTFGNYREVFIDVPDVLVEPFAIYIDGRYFGTLYPDSMIDDIMSANALSATGTWSINWSVPGLGGRVRGTQQHSGLFTYNFNITASTAGSSQVGWFCNTNRTYHFLRSTFTGVLLTTADTTAWFDNPVSFAIRNDATNTRTFTGTRSVW